MPGLVKDGAWCPKCGHDVILVTRVSSPVDNTGSLEFVHDLPKDEDCMMTGRLDDIDRVHDRLTKE